MVSLAEAKLQIEELEKKVGTLQLSYHDVRMIETSITRIARDLARMTGSEEVDKAVQKVNQLIMVLRLAQATLHAVQMASGPLGWVYAAISAVTTVGYIGSAVGMYGY